MLFFERQPRYPNNQNTKYSFYYQGEKIKFELKSSNEFDELYARRVTYVKGLSIYQWTSMEEFREDDYVILDNSRTPPHIIPGYVMDKEEISYCRFSFPESGTVKNALIRKTDIKEYGSGYIKAPGGEPNSELYDISNYDLFSFLDGVIEGCIVYDSYSGNTRGNARECLEKQRTGVSVEFETDEPYPLLDVCQNVTPYLITLGDDRRYLLIDEGVKVEAQR